jgi:single-strand DNA-binding protein
MLNKATIIGRLGQEPVLRQFATGAYYSNIVIATDESYTDRSGALVRRTEWHRVFLFDRKAQNCVKYLRKGSLVYVEGTLRTRKWQDQQGNDRYSTEIRAYKVLFLDRRGAAPADGYADVQEGYSRPQEMPAQRHEEGREWDDGYEEWDGQPVQDGPPAPAREPVPPADGGHSALDDVPF